MPTLSINGRDVQVGDEFLHLSPEQQNATVDEIAHSMGVVPQATQPPSMAEGSGRAVQHPLFDAARSFVQGIPIIGGFQPKIEAAADTGLSYLAGGGTLEAGTLSGSISDRFRQALGNISSDQSAFAQAHPVLNTGAQIAGGIASTAPLASIAIPARLSQAPGLLAAAARTGFSGVEGAALDGTDAYARGQSVWKGAELGALGGAGGSLAGEMVNPIVRYFRQTPQEFASDVIARGVGTNREGVQRALASDPLRIVADDNAPLVQALRQTRDTSGPWQDMIEKNLASRANETVDRARAAVTDASGINESLPKYLRDMDAARKAQAAPLYEETKNIEVPLNSQIAELLSRPDFRSAQAAAARKAANEGITLDADKPTVQALDYAKRALDDKIGHALMHGQRDEARVLTGMKNDLLSQVDDAVPKYAQARNIYAGHSSLMNAAEEGKAFLSRNMFPDEVQFRLGEMSEGERDAAKVGFRQDLMQKIGNINADTPQGAANAGLRTPNMRETARMVLGDDEAEKLLSAASRERMYATTNNRVTSGSSTTFNLGLDGPSTNFGLINALLRRDPVGATAKLMESAFPRLTANKRAARYDELAHALLSNSLPTAGSTPSIAPNVAAALLGITLPVENQHH